MGKVDVEMAVTATLVFSDEAHREAWLVRNGFVPPNSLDAQLVASNNFTLPDGDHRIRARRLDYDHRAHAQNLVFKIGPVAAKIGHWSGEGWHGAAMPKGICEPCEEAGSAQEDTPRLWVVVCPDGQCRSSLRSSKDRARGLVGLIGSRTCSRMYGAIQGSHPCPGGAHTIQFRPIVKQGEWVVICPDHENRHASFDFDYAKSIAETIGTGRCCNECPGGQHTVT